MWIMIDQGIRAVLHYLDDYLLLFVGDPGTSECTDALQLALRLCKRLGVLVADEKVEGPLTSLIFSAFCWTQRLENSRKTDKVKDTNTATAT